MNKTIYKKLLLLFFAVMFLFTIISRIMDSLMIAKVSTGRIQRKTINTTLEGEAVIEAGDIALITSKSGYQIEHVFVMIGSKTTPDTKLFQYQTESIEKASKSAQTEVDKLLLELKQYQLNAQMIVSASEMDVAQLEVQVAEKELALAHAKYSEKYIQYQENLHFLKDDYQKKKDLTEDELRYQNDKSYRSNEQSYETAKANRDKDVKNARRQVEDAEKELERLKKADDDDKISDAQDKLDRVQTDLADLIDQWDDTLDNAWEQIITDEDQANNIADGWTSSQVSLDDEYRLKLENEEKIIRDEIDKIEKAQSDLELAQKKMELSRKNDIATQAENNRKKQIAELSQKSIQIDIENKQLAITEMSNLLAQDGIIKAGYSGTIVKLGLEIGQITTGEETIQIATGNFRIRGLFNKDDNTLIEAGNNLTISTAEKSFNAIVDVVDLSHDTQGEFVANLDFEDAAVGMTVRYKYSEKSPIYENVLPLGAIHKDLKGYYCLAAQENNGILGTEFTAARINLEVIFSGTVDVAVEGNLGNEAQIIVETEKIIQEGDRIRLVYNNEKN